MTAAGGAGAGFWPGNGNGYICINCWGVSMFRGGERLGK